MPIVSLAMALAVSGCGTTINVWAGGNCVPYGGAALDAEAIYCGLASSAGLLEAQGEIDGPTWRLLACGGVVDFPFSVLADTATLPITIWSTWEQIRKPKPESEAAPAEEREDRDGLSEKSPASQQKTTSSFQGR